MARTIHRGSMWLIVLLTGLLGAPSLIAADTLPREISDDAFWRMISDFSEKGGSFRFEYMSNEREYQFVIPELKKITKPGGAYLGVGPEQNFTYIAASRPKIAFIFDIRRDNMIEHLMYKAIFEMSTDRRDFISRLFSRKAPSGLTERATVKALFEAYSGRDGDQELFNQNLQAIKNHLMKNHGFQLTGNDQASIGYIYQTFFDAGPGFHYLGGNFEGGAYADLMSATDRQGQAQSYLASEESFQFVREMETKNLIIPLLGDFGGVKAIRSVGRYLKDRGAVVTTFYTSNVEQYLFQQSEDWRDFYGNVATLPLDSSSTFIRSSHFAYTNGAQRPYRQVGGGNFLSLLCPMMDLVKAFAMGRIAAYDDVIRMSKD